MAEIEREEEKGYSGVEGEARVPISTRHWGAKRGSPRPWP